MTSRMTLMDKDRRVFLNRWGVETPWFGVYLHKMEGPDPSKDLHNHPWTWFYSLILRGGYVEHRTWTHIALDDARWSARTGDRRGVRYERLPGSIKKMARNECHTVAELLQENSWSLVIRGKKGHDWGFYTPDGYVDHITYETTDAGIERGDVHAREGWRRRNTTYSPEARS